MSTRSAAPASLLIAILILVVTPIGTAADVTIKIGDILVTDPGTSSVSVIDAASGVRTVISQGGLLTPVNKTVGVALALDGSVIAVHRLNGLVRINPANGEQSILSAGGLFRDPWAIAINKDTGDIYVADSGYDNDRPEINEAGKIIRVNPVSGAQELIAAGSPCNVFPANAACQNPTSAGSYLAHPYGIAIDYAVSPGSLVVGDMSSFAGNGAIIRIQPVPGGTQTLLWGPSSAVPAPEVAQLAPLGCPMGIAVEPNGNILTTVFTFPVPATPTVPPPTGTVYGCAPPGIYRIDLVNDVQRVLNANAPVWQSAHDYSVGAVIHDGASPGHVHRVITAGTSQGSTPAWNSALNGQTTDGTVTWQNIGHGANWQIPFGVSIEPVPTPSDPSAYNIIVGDEIYSALFRLEADGEFAPPGTPIASGIINITSVSVVTFAPPGSPPTPPVRSNGQPTGILTFGTTQASLSLTTNENATCRFSQTAGVAYGSMTNTFATTGGTSHSTPVGGLTNGSSYNFYVRCVDAEGSPNTDDFVIGFSVAASPNGATSTFSGTENPLSENGKWDSPGAWADLLKDNGAYAVGVNAQARLVTPTMGADQYAEITYDQDPGAGQSWVGVATRIQGASNGSGYLAIAFNGQVQLYRTDDTGTLHFEPLGGVNAAIGAPPRHLRLESEGNHHRVYFNGTLVIDHLASGTVYATGQPGIAASVFPGPTVKILSFAAGDLVPASLPTVNISDASVTEGNVGGNATALLTVTLSAASAQTVTLSYQTADGSATAPADYSAGSGTLTFAPGVTSQEITVPVVGDLTDEIDESFFVNLSAPVNATIADGEGVVTITDDDAPPSISIGDISVPEGNSGSATAVLTLTLSAASGKTVTVAYATADGTALSTSDYVTATGTATFAPGATTAPVNVTVTGDTASEADETFVVNLSAPSNATVADGQATATIVNDDGAPVLSIADATVTEGDSGTVSAQLTVTLSAASAQTVTVSYTTADGTAVAPGDYSAATGSLTFLPGETSQPLTVTIAGDTRDETDETILVTLSAPVNATIQDAQGVVTITDDDPPPSLSIADVGVTEGNGGSVNAVLTVTLAAESGKTVTVGYATANDTATSTDYSTTSGTLTFLPGVTSQQITVAVTGDVIDEINEGFFVNLSAPVNATILDGQALVTIDDDDAEPSVSIGDASIQEGNSGSSLAAFTLTLSAASGKTVTVTYATADGTAAAGSDYLAASNSATFTAGATTATVNVTINGDTTFEPAENFVVNLSVPSNATIGDGQGTGTINNDDAQPTISIGDAAVGEGNSGSVNLVLPVTLSGTSSQTITVAYATTNGTATAGTDYTAASGTLTFLPGETSQTVSMPVTGDVLDEFNETFVVNLSAPANGTILDGQATGTITDDDPLPSISVNDISVPEGNSGTSTATFTLTLSAASGKTVTVAYSTANNGTADVNSDYQPTSGTATFLPGQTSASVNVTIIGDTAFENNETFFFNLNAPSNATVADAQGQATITNDDAGPTLTISDVTVLEGNSGSTNVTFTVTLASPNNQKVTVTYATTNGTATAGADYVAKSGSLTFKGSTSQTFTVSVLGDTLDESDETFLVNLSNATNAIIGDGQAVGTITDNDSPPPPPLPTLSIADVSVDEGNSGTTTATFTVTLSAISAQPVSVQWATANGTASASSDYGAASGAATIPAGATSVPVEVLVNGDVLPEQNETFFVNLSSPTNATIADSQATGVITNEDGPPPPPPPVGLVAAYGFEEGLGAATTADSSGNGHNGSISGATWTDAGHSGKALSFDGVNDLVTVVDHADLDVTRVTMMAWVRPTTATAARTVLIKERNNGLAYALYARDPKMPVGSVNIGGGNDRSAEGSAELPPNTWTHIAATHDGLMLRLYVNGALVGTRSASGNIVTSSQALRIGGNLIAGEYFAGIIDDVRIYNRALSQSEIQTDMNVAVVP